MIALERVPKASPISRPADAGDEAEAALELVRQLCEALSAERVSYCHWKSNEALDRSARGDNDLDLLVSRRHAQRFEAIIGRLGFKAAQAPPRKRAPGMFHAYGLDEASGKLVHIHGHYLLVLGDDMTKNYRLPIEEAYLDSAEQGGLFRVPGPELELIVFVLRMVLKHSTMDAVMTGQASLSPSESRELAYVTGRADLELARASVRERLPFLGVDLWDRCVRCLRPGTSLQYRVRTAHRLERALGTHARRPPWADPFVRVARRFRVTLRRRVLHHRPPRLRPQSGGALIAVVGGDGAGKSTAVDELHRWLSAEFDTVKLHLGKPPRSLTSAIVHRIWKRSVRSVVDRPEISERPTLSLSDGGSLSLREVIKLTRRVMTSRDRYLTYRRARRFAADGGIVICDRFPIPEITLMDGPATARVVGSAARSPLIRYLARLEERYYGRIRYPDVLVVLRVDPEVAVRRRHGSETEEFVRRRSQEIWRLPWEGVPATVIDAGRPKDEVLSQIKSVIWSRL